MNETLDAAQRTSRGVVAATAATPDEMSIVKQSDLTRLVDALRGVLRDCPMLPPATAAIVDRVAGDLAGLAAVTEQRAERQERRNIGVAAEARSRDELSQDDHGYSF